MHCYPRRLLRRVPSAAHCLTRRPPLHILAHIDIGKRCIHRDLSENEQTLNVVREDFRDFSLSVSVRIPLHWGASVSVRIPLHWGATIPKAKRQETDRVKAATRFVHRTSITPQIF